MTASLRRPGWAVAVLLGALLVLPWLAPSRTGTLPAADAAELSAVDRYGSCLAGQGQGDLLLVIDESGSLVDNDPDAARVDAAKYLLQGLTRFSQSSGARIDVAVAGFAEGFSQPPSWTPLTPESLPGLTDEVATYADKNEGRDTDYWWALEGSRRALAGHASEYPGDRRCQAVAWFSDGQLDLDVPRTSEDLDHYATLKPYAAGIDPRATGAMEQAADAAKEAICRDGGLADQLRSSGVVTFGIGLAAGDTSPREFDLMRSITTGEPMTDGEGCGKLTDPTPGEFHLASDIDGLLLAFDALSTPGPPPITQDAAVCQGEPCAEAHRFVLDSSIGAVHILGSADVSGVEAVLTLPSGTSVPLPRDGGTATSRIEADGIGVSYSWLSPRSLSLDLKQPSPPVAAWTGVWSLAFVDGTASSPGARSRSNIHIFGNLFPSWPERDSTVLHTGEVLSGVTLGVADSEGNWVNPTEILGSVRLSAVLVDSDGGEVVVTPGLDKTQIGSPLDIDLTDVKPGPATMRLTLEVTTADAVAPDGSRTPGTALAPRTVSLPVTVAPPIDFPLPAGSIDFGATEGVADLGALLKVTGPGCVWFQSLDSPTFGGVPDGVGDLTLSSSAATSPDDCVELADGQVEQLPVRLTAQRAGNGTVNGTFEVGVAPIGELNRAMTVPVDFTADLRKADDPAVEWSVFLAALLLGVGIPLGTAYAGKYLSTKIPPEPLYARRVPVTVESDVLLRDGTPFELRDDDLVSLVPIPGGGGRRVVADGVELRARIGRSPFGSGHVTASAPGRAAASVASPTGTGKGDGGALLPLAVHNTWVLLHDPTGPRDEAELLLLVGAQTSSAQREELVAGARAQVPRALEQLREAARPADEASATASFAGATGGGSHRARRSPFDQDEPSAGAPRPTTSPFDFPDRSDG